MMIAAHTVLAILTVRLKVDIATRRSLGTSITITIAVAVTMMMAAVTMMMKTIIMVVVAADRITTSCYWVIGARLNTQEPKGGQVTPKGG
jgi:hypothetical protein